MKEVHLIYNPVSAKGTCVEKAKQIVQWASGQKDLKIIVHETENVGHATAITMDLTSTNKPVTILVLGGDGSLNEVLNGINDFNNTTIGILPFGSGNDLFRSLGIENQDLLYLANEYINNPCERKIDYMIINDEYRCINVAGLGMSAKVIALRNRMKRFGPKAQYMIATIIKSLFWRILKLKVSIDGQPAQDISTMWLTINNGSYIGGGLVTAPEAKIDDGILTISYVNKFNHLKTLPILIKIKKGKVANVKTRHLLTCKEINIDGNNLTLEYDGNLLENLNHINIKVIPNRLRLLTIRK